MSNVFLMNFKQYLVQDQIRLNSDMIQTRLINDKILKAGEVENIKDKIMNCAELSGQCEAAAKSAQDSAEDVKDLKNLCGAILDSLIDGGACDGITEGMIEAWDQELHRIWEVKS